MKLTDFPPGMHISEAVAILLRAANSSGSAKGIFNDIAVMANAGDTENAVLSRYAADRDMRAAAYKNSPEGLASARLAKDSLDADQHKADSLMADLPSLNFSDDARVLDWVCSLQGPSDHIGVVIDKNAVLTKFAEHGLLPGVNCGADFDGDNRRNSFEWLVGQALDGLATVAIHGVVHKFAAEWKAKFAGRAALGGHHD